MFERIQDWLRARWIFVAAGLVLGGAGWLALQFRDPAGQVMKRQTRLLKAITDKDMATFASAVSDGYHDDWGFDRTNVTLAMDDVASQFISLQISPQAEQFAIDGNEATFSARLKLDGRSVTAPGMGILSMAASVQEPYVFTWQKESFWPWSWRLVKMANSGLPVPREYRPGMLREAASGGAGGALEKLLDR